MLASFLKSPDTEVKIMTPIAVQDLKYALLNKGMNIHEDMDEVYDSKNYRAAKALDPNSWDLNRVEEMILFYGKKNFAYCSQSGVVDKTFKFFIWD